MRTALPLQAGVEGPVIPFVRKGSTTSLAIQTHRFLCTQQLRRKSDGVGIAMRRTERLFGEKAVGRSSHVRGKLGRLNEERGQYEPRKDTCVRAFVRLLNGEDAF
eukprot:1195695-Pleurochrysis_carterae.AAC.1